MNTSAASVPAASGTIPTLADPREEAVGRPWALIAAIAGLTAAAAAIRFIPLGVQSFHHDEVITVMRVIPGTFGHMLHEVVRSESNPPLYYVLAWGWAKAFGRDEWGIRSLSALLGTLTVPVGYAIGRQLSGRRVGLILMGLLAFNPMLIWYSQEARSYALLSMQPDPDTSDRRSRHPARKSHDFFSSDAGFPPQPTKTVCVDAKGNQWRNCA